MLKVFIVGISGKMGKMICNAAQSSDDIEICGGLDAFDGGVFPTFKRAADVNVAADVIIDFSRPETLDEVISLCNKLSCPAVIATTGYDDGQLKKIDELSKRRGVLISGNMSFGVNLLTELVKSSAAALGVDFDVEIVEKHHNMKVDAPSGTALMLAQSAAEARKEKSKIVAGRSGKSCKRERGDIGISSVRGGTIVGQHDVEFIGDDEIITLSHTALSRKIFAFGSLKAARFMAGKKSGKYDMKDVLGIKKA